MQAKIGQMNAGAAYKTAQAGQVAPLADANIAQKLAQAGLYQSQGNLYDVRTKMQVPMDQAQIRLRTAQAGAANANAQSLPAFRAGLVANGATTAGANVLNANAHQQSVQQQGVYQQGLLGLGSDRNAVAQGNLGLATAKYQHPMITGGKGLLPSGLTNSEDRMLAQESQKNVASAAGASSALRSGKLNGTELTDADRAQLRLQIQNAQQRNAEINQRRSTLAPMPIQSVGSRVPAGTRTPYAPPLPTAGASAYSGPQINTQADYNRLSASQKRAYSLMTRPHR